MKCIVTLALVFSASAALAQTPAAADAPRDRWTPWIGCWQVSEESIEDAERLLAALTGSASGPTTTRGARVCVTASPNGGATMTTLVNDKVVSTETIVADGKSRPLTDPACRGTQQAEWSALASRVYARTTIACGDQGERTVSGLSTVVSGPLWIDIQMIESGVSRSMRVRRYRPVARSATSTARTLGTMPLGGKLSIADITEAAAKVAPEVLQAAVMELGQGGYNLNAKRLVELDDAGVPDSVIDLMVAMSFPQKFVVERPVPVSGPGGYSDAGLWGPNSYWPYYAHPLYYAAYYSPFGYSYWGYVDPWYYGSYGGGYYPPPGVVVLPPGGGGGTIPEPSGTGRVVDGAGYTRIRPNVPSQPSRTGDGTRSSGSSAGSSSSGSGSNSGGSGVSTGGYSGGGSGSGGRVAVPRPPGGN